MALAIRNEHSLSPASGTSLIHRQGLRTHRASLQSTIAFQPLGDECGKSKR